MFLRRWALAASLGPASAALAPTPLRAQVTAKEDSVQASRGYFYRRMAAGFASSMFLHESAHFAASYLMGYHPRMGFYRLRPTVFSGIEETGHRHDQFLFSAAGVAVQELLDELILDIPHQRGGPFERGVLAGGIGTILFYVSLGRNSRVSDISVMARTSTLSKTQLSLIFGSVSALHALRIGRDHRSYCHFFLAPADRGGLKAGISVSSP